MPDTRRKGSAAAAKDQQSTPPVSGWEAAMSECIHVSGKLEGEDAALKAMQNDRSILYLGTVRVCSCCMIPRTAIKLIDVFFEPPHDSTNIQNYT